MRLTYRTKYDEKLCNDFVFARRKLGSDVAERLMKAIGFAEAASTLSEFVHVPQFRFHPLKYRTHPCFGVDLVKTSGMRLILTPLDCEGRPDDRERPIDQILVECTIAEAEVSNHYED